MIIDDKSTLKTLKNYLFLLTILAIITIQNVHSIIYLHKKFIFKYWNKSLNSFYYFLNDKNHYIENIMKITARIGISLIPLIDKNCKSLYLSIDDTLQPKFGDKFEHRYKLFDYTKQSETKYINGHCIVSMALNITYSNR